MKKLYRYEIDYSGEDGPTEVYLNEHPVIRETERTYFINPPRPVAGDKLKRVSKTAFNTFAYDSKKLAKLHFERRARKRISWYKYWIKECEKGLEIIETKI